MTAEGVCLALEIGLLRDQVEQLRQRVADLEMAEVCRQLTVDALDGPISLDFEARHRIRGRIEQDQRGTK